MITKAHFWAEILPGEEIDLTSPSMIMFWGLLDGVRKSKKICKYIPQGKPLEIIDVGACIGAWSLSMATRYEQAHITAIEPCPVTLPHLIHNISHYNVRIINRAADNCSQTITIQSPREEEYSVSKNQWWRLEGNYGTISAYGTSGNNKFDVESVRIDDVCKTADVVKMDVEGMEKRALEGMKRILLESRPILQIELREINQRRAGLTTENIIELLDIDYNYALIDSDKIDGIFYPKEKKVNIYDYVP